MRDFLLVGVALGAGVGFDRIGLLALALFFPWGFTVLVVLLAWLGSRSSGDRAVRFLEAVGDELRSGSSLRQSIAAAAAAVGDLELAEDSLTLSYREIGRRAAASFPRLGNELAVSIAGAAGSGAPPADLFDELASLAIAHDEIRREVRVAAAPGRVAAGLFIGAPGLYLGYRWAVGDLGALFASGPQRIAGLAGLGLFLAGLAGALLVLWRAR